MLITLLIKDQSLFKTLKSSFDFLSADISKEEKLKTTKTVKTIIKTLKLSKVVTLKIKVIYILKITENTQQIKKLWIKINKQKKSVTISVKAVQKSSKISVRDRRLLIIINFI